MIIAVDFDGTCVTHDYPLVGKEIGASEVLKGLVKNGHQLILFTMRSIRDDGTNPLQDAINWFESHGIPLYGINENPNQKSWTKSPKAYAQLYIDDAALGCPLIFKESFHSRPYVDWKSVEFYLIKLNLLPIHEPNKSRNRTTS
jgi:hypothetical protein